MAPQLSYSDTKGDLRLPVFHLRGCWLREVVAGPAVSVGRLRGARPLHAASKVKHPAHSARRLLYLSSLLSGSSSLCSLIFAAAPRPLSQAGNRLSGSSCRSRASVPSWRRSCRIPRWRRATVHQQDAAGTHPHGTTDNFHRPIPCPHDRPSCFRLLTFAS